MLGCNWHDRTGAYGNSWSEGFFTRCYKIVAVHSNMSIRTHIKRPYLYHIVSLYRYLLLI